MKYAFIASIVSIVAGMAMADQDYCVCDSVQVITSTTRVDLGTLTITGDIQSGCATACVDNVLCTTWAAFPGSTDCLLFQDTPIGFELADAGQFTQSLKGTCASQAGIQEVASRCTDLTIDSAPPSGPSARARARSLKNDDLAKRRLHGECDMC